MKYQVTILLISLVLSINTRKIVSAACKNTLTTCVPYKKQHSRILQRKNTDPYAPQLHHSLQRAYSTPILNPGNKPSFTRATTDPSTFPEEYGAFLNEILDEELSECDEDQEEKKVEENHEHQPAPDILHALQQLNDYDAIIPQEPSEDVKHEITKYERRSLFAGAAAGGTGLALAHWVHKIGPLARARAAHERFMTGAEIPAIFGALKVISAVIKPMARPLATTFVGACAWWKLKEHIRGPLRAKQKKEFEKLSTAFSTALAQHKKQTKKILAQNLEEHEQALALSLKHLDKELESLKKENQEHRDSLARQAKVLSEDQDKKNANLRAILKDEHERVKKKIFNITQQVKKDLSAIQKDVKQSKLLAEDQQEKVEQFGPKIDQTKDLMEKLVANIRKQRKYLQQ